MRNSKPLRLAIALGLALAASAATTTATATVKAECILPPGETRWFDSDHPFAPQIGGRITGCDCQTYTWGAIGMIEDFIPLQC